MLFYSFLKNNVIARSITLFVTIFFIHSLFSRKKKERKTEDISSVKYSKSIVVENTDNTENTVIINANLIIKKIKYDIAKLQ